MPIKALHFLISRLGHSSLELSSCSALSFGCAHLLYRLLVLFSLHLIISSASLWWNNSIFNSFPPLPIAKQPAVDRRPLSNYCPPVSKTAFWSPISIFFVCMHVTLFPYSIESRFAQRVSENYHPAIIDHIGNNILPFPRYVSTF